LKESREYNRPDRGPPRTTPVWPPPWLRPPVGEAGESCPVDRSPSGQPTQGAGGVGGESDRASDPPAVPPHQYGYPAGPRRSSDAGGAVRPIGAGDPAGPPLAPDEHGLVGHDPGAVQRAERKAG